MENYIIITMGIKTIGAAMIAGAAGLYILNPGVNHTINDQAKSYVPSSNSVTGFFNSVKPTPKKPSTFLEAIFGIQDTASQDLLLRSDGTRVQKGEIYYGNTWPKEWPVLNEDGSYDRDYIRWHERKSGRR